MKIKLLISTIAFMLTFISFHPVYAYANTAGSSASLAYATQTKIKDNRAVVLQHFLEDHNSPLAAYSKTFVEEADKNKIDWKLVVSIAGNESQFGQMIPPYSYNGWGYGVYGNNVRNFTSWEDGIATVSKAIRTDYIDKWGATNIAEIGSFYAEDRAWANKVMAYSAQIDEFENQNSNSSLSISF